MNRLKTPGTAKDIYGIIEYVYVHLRRQRKLPAERMGKGLEYASSPFIKPKYRYQPEKDLVGYQRSGKSTQIRINGHDIKA